MPRKDLPATGAVANKTFIEYFAGIGLMHEALAPLGWDCVLANDNDPMKVAAYQQNFPDVPLSSSDVRDLTPSQLPAARLATASFPCIDLSQAGGRKGINGNHSGVVWAFLDQIRALESAGRAPEFLLLENVAGLLTLHEGNSIDLLLHEIADLGYLVDLVQVDARHFVPQARNRVFIVAARGVERDYGEMPIAHIRRYNVQKVYQRNRDLPWHFFDFPALPTAPVVTLDDVLEDLNDDDPRWWNAERLEYFWSHLEHDHRPQLEQMVRDGVTRRMTAVRRGRRRGLREQIFNLRFDGLASCLRTPKGGSSIQFVVSISKGRVAVRRITGLESARLQGVTLPGMSPDFSIPESEQAALFAFGDAVCVPAVRWVIEHSIETVTAQKKRTRPTQMPLDLSLAG